MPAITVTRKLPQAVEDRLLSLFDDVRLNPSDTPLDAAALRQAMEHSDGVLGTVTDRFEASLFDGVRARIVANFAVGVNNIDLEAAKAAGVAVTNTPDVLTDATADTALMLMLMVLRRAGESAALLREGRWEGFSPTLLLGASPQGKTLGIVGYGRIGQAMAQRGAALGMEILFHNRSRVANPAVGRQAASLAEVMERADVVSLHLPGGGANAGAISAEMLALMRPGTALINTARGDVVDEPALVAACASGRISAGLDVFAAEPTVPAAFLDMPNVVLMPHIGSATEETRTAMGMLAVDNLDAFFAGRTCPARVV